MKLSGFRSRTTIDLVVKYSKRRIRQAAKNCVYIVLNNPISLIASYKDYPCINSVILSICLGGSIILKKVGRKGCSTILETSIYCLIVSIRLLC